MGRRPQPPESRFSEAVGTKLTPPDAAALKARLEELGVNEHTAVRTAVLQWLGSVSPLDPSLERAVEDAVERGVRRALKARGLEHAAALEAQVSESEREELDAIAAALFTAREPREHLAKRLGVDLRTLHAWIDGAPNRRRMTAEERAALGLEPRQLALA